MTKDPIRASEMVVIGVMCYVCSCLNVYNISFFYCLDVSSFRVVMYHRPSCHQILASSAPYNGQSCWVSLCPRWTGSSSLCKKKRHKDIFERSQEFFEKRVSSGRSWFSRGTQHQLFFRYHGSCSPFMEGMFARFNQTHLQSH
ncbi:hypothetical protein YC2023_122136 [Brassica napus]